jgi:hypothetical protein
MPKRYVVRHMFNHRDAEGNETFFTRDNEGDVGKLPDAVVKDKLAKGFIVEAPADPSVREEAISDKEQLKVDAEMAEGKRPGRGGR